MDSQVVKKAFIHLQAQLCQSLQQYETAPISTDVWERPEGGGGTTRVLRHGTVFDSVGVNFSHVFGSAMPKSATSHRPELAGRKFEAMGVSSVIHPHNPYVPTAHMNVRFLVAHKEGSAPIWWFGGGYDLTPYYPFLEDVKHWHKTAFDLCQPFGEGIYPRYKKWADEYFYLPHRQETRGVGGLFFDDLNSAAWGWEYAKCFQFVQAVGESFWKAYAPILDKRYQHPFEARHRAFQAYRRGRYVEFNLLYDRGTLFGIHSQGRTESIFISLPPRVHWEYQWQPVPNSEEAVLYDTFLKARDWLRYGLEPA